MFAELRTFVAIARYGTFAAAGDRIGLTQAAVSGHVRRLEARLGFALFDRSGRVATLTPAGARTLARAQGILAAVEALGDDAAEATAGTLRVGAIASLQTALLARALMRFREHFPAMTVQVVPGLSVGLVDQVEAGDLDLAVLVGPPQALPPELAWRRLALEPYVLAVPSGWRGDDWRELLAAGPFLRYDHLSLGGRAVNRFLRDMPFPIPEAIEAPFQAMLPMVQAGLGVALVPLAEAQLPLPAGVRTLPLTGARLEREIGLVIAGRDASPWARFAAQCIAEAA